jgi:putative endonuclease
VLSDKKKYFVYILEMANGHFYTGYTTDLTRRFQEHCSGKKGAKYTRAMKPVRIARSWEITGTRGKALQVEAAIKKMSRPEKIELIANPELLFQR